MLEEAVASLVERYRRLEGQHGAVRKELAERERRIAELEGQVLALNQRRQDALKWVDELIAQLDQLDGQLGALEAPGE